MTDPRRDCLAGHRLARLSVRSFAAVTEHHRAWDACGLVLAECRLCHSTLSVTVEDWDAAHPIEGIPENPKRPPRAGVVAEAPEATGVHEGR